MLRAQRLAKTFVLHLQGGNQIHVLDCASVELRAGECLALIGPSGAGKSTLLRSLYGSYLIDQGAILVWHRGAWIDTARCDPRLVLEVRHETIGYVSQFLRVVPRIPALEIVAEAARGYSCEQARVEAETLLLRLNIPRRLHSLPPATFSGGEQQRVNLARGFIGAHPILLLDEPTASLDAENRDVVITMIQEAKARGVALAGIFHDRDVRDSVADSVQIVSPLREAG
jgi:alpha-D-ribose 1-methylphosphonate 5-triphosphate synthase subunit PhnL